MKIGILTLPLHTNYGGNLQAYALMTVLKDMGHDVWLVNRQGGKIPGWRIPIEIAKRVVKKFALGKKNVVIFAEAKARKEYALISQYTQPFINTHIQPQTKAAHTTEELSELVEKDKFDAIIVGSDQVWRIPYSPSIEDYFFGFLTGNKVKRISYAASFGTENWEFSKEQENNCAALLKQFDAVSVREASGVEMCKKYFGVKAQHVLDPTMLLDVSKYINLIEPLKKEKKKEGVLVYILDETPDKSEVINSVSKLLGKSVFRVNAKTEDKSVSIEERIAPPTEEWIKGFYEADFIITDSFHACVFAILFKKPFLIYGNPYRGLARFKSLLAMFGLEDQLILSSKDYSAEKTLKEIDWQRVHEILNEKKKEAKTFLKTILG